MIETELEPPLTPLDDEDDEPTFTIAVVLREADGTGKSAYIAMPPDADNEQIADQLIQATIAAAGLRSPALAEAVRNRLNRKGK